MLRKPFDQEIALEEWRADLLRVVSVGVCIGHDLESRLEVVQA